MCSESLIKLVKRAVVIAIGNSILLFGKLQILNQVVVLALRIYIWPNHLLLGRLSARVQDGLWDDSGDKKFKLSLLKEL